MPDDTDASTTSTSNATEPAAVDQTANLPADGADGLEDLEREFSALLLTVERVQSRRVLPEIGRLEKMAFHLLGRLVVAGPMRPSALAALVGLDLSTVSRHIGTLEAAGLVERAADPADRRAHLLRATPDGEALLQRLREHRRERMERVVGCWPDTDRRELARLLHRLNADLAAAEDLAVPSRPRPRRTPRRAGSGPATTGSEAPGG